MIACPSQLPGTSRHCRRSPIPRRGGSTGIVAFALAAGALLTAIDFAPAAAARPASARTAPTAGAGSGMARRPIALLPERDRGSLLVLCEKSGTIVRWHPADGIVRERPLAEQPCAIDRDAVDGRLYVTCRRGQQLLELDGDTLEIQRRLQLIGDPTGVALSADRSRLFVALHSLDRVAVVDRASFQEERRLVTGNGPEQVVRVPGGEGAIAITNLLSNPIRPDEVCRNELTIIDGARARVLRRIELLGANIGRQIAFDTEGHLGFLAISRPKNLVPMVQVARGWVVTNGFALIDPRGEREPLQLLVDLPNRAYADPCAVALSADGRKAYLSASGSDAVLAIELDRVARVRDRIERGELHRPSDHLGLSRQYVTARIAVGADPRALALGGSDGHLYVANRLDDSLTEIDPASDTVVATHPLGTAPEGDLVARGERFFHNASRTFQSQFSCSSCHPDSGFDGLQYDLEPDDLGRNILDNRNLRGVRGTAPFKWVGTNPDIATQCGTRTAKWIVRTGWLESAGVVALTEYIRSLDPVVNPYRRSDGEWTPAQRRGKELFERTTRNDGTPIPERDRCSFCHGGPLFTNRQKFDVGTKAPSDGRAEFDNAHLINIFESAPYLHDGRARSLEEIWTVYNPDDRHGISSDWTKQQLNDLVEYLKAIGEPLRPRTDGLLGSRGETQ